MGHAWIRSTQQGGEQGQEVAHKVVGQVVEVGRVVEVVPHMAEELGVVEIQRP